MLSASNTFIGINVGEMCFISPFKDVCQLRWQQLSPVVSRFSTSIRLLSSLPLSVHLSLSVVPHPVFIISGLSRRRC